MIYVGVDLGGTNIKAGICSERGEIICKDMINTDKTKTYKGIAGDIAGLVNKMANDNSLNTKEIKSIGIGVPGTCDTGRGIVMLADNIGFKNAPMADEMKKYFDVPVLICNDANCAAYGEYQVMKDEADNIVFVTLGTGVGGGIILNKKLYTGKNGTAGEIGHIPIEKNGIRCNCGSYGCWEAYASVTALIRMTEEYANENPDSRVAQKCREEGVCGKTAFSLAKEDDEGGRYIVKNWIDNVSCGLVTIINILQPEYIVIGGAISREGDFLLKPIIENAKKNAYYNVEGQTKIIAASLLNDAGIIGAALLGKGDNI